MIFYQDNVEWQGILETLNWPLFRSYSLLTKWTNLTNYLHLQTKSNNLLTRLKRTKEVNYCFKTLIAELSAIWAIYRNMVLW